MPHSPFHVNILQHFLHPAAPLTWPALPRSCPLSSCRFSSSSQCFTPGKSALPSPPPTHPVFSPPRTGACGLKSRSPEFAKYSAPGKDSELFLPTPPRCAGALFPNAGSPAPSPVPARLPGQLQPRCQSCRRGGPAAAPPGPRGRPQGLCPEPARQKVFPLRRLPGPGTQRDGDWLCPGYPYGSSRPAAPASFRAPSLRAPR